MARVRTPASLTDAMPRRGPTSNETALEMKTRSSGVDRTPWKAPDPAVSGERRAATVLSVPSAAGRPAVQPGCDPPEHNGGEPPEDGRDVVAVAEGRCETARAAMTPAVRAIP